MIATARNKPIADYQLDFTGHYAFIAEAVPHFMSDELLILRRSRARIRLFEILIVACLLLLHEHRAAFMVDIDSPQPPPDNHR